MKSFSTIVCLVCSLFVFSCNRQTLETFEVQEPADETTESAKVYTAAIEDAFSDRHEILYISNKMTTFDDDADLFDELKFNGRIGILKERFDSVDEDVLRSFLTKSKKPSFIDPATIRTLGEKHQFVDGIQVEKELAKSVLSTAQSTLPGPILRLSVIGYNSSFDEAFLNIEYVACPLCGFGTNYQLEKVNGKWKIKKRFGEWIS